MTAATAIVRQLVTTITAAALYSDAHPQVQRLRAELFATITNSLSLREEILLMIVGEEVIADGFVLEGGLHVERFVTTLRSRDIGHLKFIRGISQREVDDLVAALAGSAPLSGTRSSAHLRVGRIELEGLGRRRQEWLPESNISPADMATVQDFYRGVELSGQVDPRGISEMVTGFIELIRNREHPMLALAPLRELDEYTFSHSINVCILNIAQASSLGIDGPALHDIGVAGLLHDIGKLFIPKEILAKPDKLTDAEWEQMRLHPVKGARYLLQTPGIPRLAAIVAFEHHMKTDFSGYPRVRQGWSQNLASHITTLSDFFDALRTRRAYRDSLDLHEVATMLLERVGTDFHPTLARNFLLILSRIIPAEGAAPASFR